MKTNSNNLEPLAQSALLALYELGSAEQFDAARAQGRARPHVSTVAAKLGVSQLETARVLWALDAAGLVWAERCRLTLAGLSVAVRIWSQRARARRHRAA